MRAPRAAGLAFALVTLAPATGLAIGPVDVEIAALAGAGTNPSYPPTLLGFGAGGRAGVTLRGFYAGVAAMDYAGGSATLDIRDPPVHDSTHSFFAGGQAGYTLKLGVLRVRPLVELGVAELTEAGATESAFYVEPGFAILVPLGPMFLGFDLNGLIVPSHARPCFGSCVAPPSTEVALTLHGELGVRF